MHLFGGAAARKPAGEADPVRDGSLKTFAQDVIQASQQTPVLVDFWAPWCGPCKQLTPLLEKLVRATKGKVKLVKINIDENPELAQQLRIQSVPTVYAFLGGQPVTGFTGAQPESQIKLLIDRLVGETGGSDLTGALEGAKAAAERGDTRTAKRLFEAVLEEDPANLDAVGGLTRALIAERAFDEARQLLEFGAQGAAGPSPDQRCPGGADAGDRSRRPRRSGPAAGASPGQPGRPRRPLQACHHPVPARPDGRGDRAAHGHRQA